MKTLFHLKDHWGFQLQILKHDLVFNCEKIENLIPSIKKSKQNNPATKQKIEQFTIDYLYKLDGLASKRICNAIIGLLEGKIKNE